MKFAAQAFARLVRVLLGSGAVADSTVDWGTELTILGVHVQLSERGIRTCPEQAKVIKWMQSIEEALDKGRLKPAQASKMSGRLAWLVRKLFKNRGVSQEHVKLKHEKGRLTT